MRPSSRISMYFWVSTDPSMKIKGVDPRVLIPPKTFDKKQFYFDLDSFPEICEIIDILMFPYDFCVVYEPLVVLCL